METQAPAHPRRSLYLIVLPEEGAQAYLRSATRIHPTVAQWLYEEVLKQVRRRIRLLACYFRGKPRVCRGLWKKEGGFDFRGWAWWKRPSRIAPLSAMLCWIQRVSDVASLLRITHSEA